MSTIVTNFSQFNFGEEDYENLVRGGNNVLGNSRYFFQLSWKETQEDFKDRLKSVTYRNHSKQVLTNYEAYIISEESIMLDDVIDIEQRVRSILDLTNMLGSSWVLGLENSIEIFKPSQYKVQDGLIVLSKPSESVRYEINLQDKTLVKFVKDVERARETNFNPEQLQLMTFSDGRISLIADVAPQSVEINNLRSVVTTQAYKTLKDWRFGPAPSEDDDNVTDESIKTTSYMRMLEGDAVTPGILQYNPQNMKAVADLVSERTLELATEVNLVEEFSTELKNVAESAVAKQIRRAALTATVNLMAKILEKTFNRIQTARFEVYDVGILEDRGSAKAPDGSQGTTQAKLRPNLVIITARVFQEQSNLVRVEEYDEIRRIVKTEGTNKTVKKLLIDLLPVPDEKKEELTAEVDEATQPDPDTDNLVDLNDLKV